MTSLRVGVGVLLPLLLSLLLLAVSSSTFAGPHDDHVFQYESHNELLRHYVDQTGGSVDSYAYNSSGVCLRDDSRGVVYGDLCEYLRVNNTSFFDNSYTVVDPTGGYDLSENIVDPNNWNITYGPDPGGCCSSISGSAPLYDANTDTIKFSYGYYTVAQTIAINQALASSGVQVDGYTYSWSYRNITNSGNNGDTLVFNVQIKDAGGNVVETRTYDYSNTPHADGNTQNGWRTDSGIETFGVSYLDPSSVQLNITGRDGGFWAGYYGPEVKDIFLNLRYSADPCFANPLHDPSCPGYAEAYAQYLYDQNCAADPLYDSGCPGYTQAYYNQQCSINALYDSGCPNYAQAYFNQQCSLDGLYDMACPNYAQAYYNQQCSLDPLYDRGCDGYAEAYAQEYIVNAETPTDSQETVSSTSETLSTVTDAEQITQTPITGDSTVDSILSDLSDMPVVTTVVAEPVTNVEPEPSQEEQSQEEQAETELVALEVEDVETETKSDESDSESGTDDDESSDESEGETSDGGDSESEEKDSKKEKMKKSIAKKASQLAQTMSNLASLEAQQAVQAQVLALINYVPDFNTYQRQINGGYLPDAVGYADTQVPESKRGLRNGLAQQLLHEQMVEMQYENLSSQ